MFRAYKVENPNIRRWFLVEGEENFTKIEEHYKEQDVSVSFMDMASLRR